MQPCIVKLIPGCIAYAWAFKSLCILASALLTNVFTSYGRFWAVCASARHLRHPLCWFPQVASVFHHHISEAPPLLAVTANLTPRSCPKRVAYMRRQVRCLARDPQRWERDSSSARAYPRGQRSIWPNWWCGPFRLLQVCRVPARTLIKDGFLNGPTTWRATSAGGSSWVTASCLITGTCTAFQLMRTRSARDSRRAWLCCVTPFTGHGTYIIWLLTEVELRRSLN